MGTEIHVSVRTNTLIIGGGIIGVSIASSLTDRDVMIIDSGEPRFGTSIGNAGHVVVSHAQPFAAPGMIALGAKSLLHADGAFDYTTFQDTKFTIQDYKKILLSEQRKIRKISKLY